MNLVCKALWVLFLFGSALRCSVVLSADAGNSPDKGLAAAAKDSTTTSLAIRLTNVPYAFSIPRTYFSGSESVSLDGKEIGQLQFMLLLPNFDVHSLGVPTYETRTPEGADKKIDVRAVRGQAKFVI